MANRLIMRPDSTEIRTSGPRGMESFLQKHEEKWAAKPDWNQNLFSLPMLVNDHQLRAFCRKHNMKVPKAIRDNRLGLWLLEEEEASEESLQVEQ